MSYPLVPPPASDTGAWSIPRTLQRWLDVNPATCLTRTQAFITLPAFNVAVNWLGYSDIIAAFNYEGPNNFSLTGFNVEPTPMPNYMLCIMWIDENNGVHRYSLWRNVGEVIYFNLPVYSGQKIGKNFRFEIWSTNSSPAIQGAPVQVYTSVLGKSDYRWSSDFTLVSADIINTQFGTSKLFLSAPSIDGTDNTLYLPQWNTDTIPVLSISGTDGSLLYGVGGSSIIPPHYSNIQTADTADTINGNVTPRIVVFSLQGTGHLRLGHWNGASIDSQFDLIVNATSVVGTFGAVTITTTYPVQTKPINVVWSFKTDLSSVCTLEVFSFDGTLLGASSGNYVTATDFRDQAGVQFSIGVASTSQCYCVGVVITYVDTTSIAQSLSSMFGFVLPLVFPAGSYPVTNVKQIYTPQPNYI